MHHKKHVSRVVDRAVREQGHPSLRALTNRRVLADEISELIAREFIFSDVVPAGGLLPSERHLIERYGVSRVTVRAGLRSLREAGLISVRQGLGATVLARSSAARYELNHLSSLQVLAQETGNELAISTLELLTVEADAEIAEDLDVPVGEPIGVARSVVSADEGPVAWVEETFGLDVVPLDDVPSGFNGCVLDLVLNRLRRAVDYADCEIDAIKMPSAIAARLGLERDAIGLRLRETIYAIDGKPLMCCRSWHGQLIGHAGFLVRRRRRVGS